MAQNNTNHPVEPNKSSGTSPPPEPPIATPLETALTGVPTLDICVRDYRMVPKVLAELKFGRVRGSFEAILQTRVLLVGNDLTARLIAVIDNALEQAGANINDLKEEMRWAKARRVAVGAYIEAGEHCYEVSQGLAERLCATELHGVTGDSLRLPFGAIAIVVPEELQDLAHVVFVSILPAYKVRNAVTGELVTEPVLSIVAYRIDGTNSDTFVLTPKINGGDIRESLAESLRQYGNDDDSITLEGAKERVTRLFWWTVNVCLYITHGGAQLEPRHPNADAECRWRALNAEPGPKRRQRLLSQYNAQFRQRIYLGRRVESLGLNTREPLSVRTLVAGHWRNQVCGAGRQNRRLTWIEPFWRGPREAPVSNPIRVATEARAISSKA